MTRINVRMCDEGEHTREFDPLLIVKTRQRSSLPTKATAGLSNFSPCSVKFPTLLLLLLLRPVSVSWQSVTGGLAGELR